MREKKNVAFPGLAGRIREQRKLKGWTQRDLADRLGMRHQTTIANWETQTVMPMWQHIATIAELFGCSPEFLVYGVPGPAKFVPLLRSVLAEMRPELYRNDDLREIEIMLIEGRMAIAEAKRQRSIASKLTKLQAEEAGDDPEC